MRLRRRCSRCLPSCFSWRSRCVTRSFARRRPISSFVSPGPRPPMPPVRRESESSFWARRGIAYFSCASSTWSLPSRLSARWAKMSRMSCVRSMTLRSVCLAMPLACAGVSSRSKTSTLASSSHGPDDDLLELALAHHEPRIDALAQLHDGVGHLRPGGARELARARACSPRPRARRPAPFDLSPTCTRMARPSFALTSRAPARRANSASRSAMRRADVDVRLPDGERPHLAVRQRRPRRPGRCARRRGRAARRRGRSGWPRRDRAAGARGRRGRRASAARRGGACARGAARGSAPRPRAGARCRGASACPRPRRRRSRPARSGGRARPPAARSRATPPRASASARAW